ncbi:lipid A biosynthesis acyltransferase [Acidithiobacillus marinus]|uniref:Lipid A biosynthesis acyltransferase n=1 Tax=Acidithiobacillus marinus TaxID=187490 RepID=A0A2I1DI76_9PROT|nr:lipid A biosynthesis acyltransferase [Acidithiobacillus marinus]
MWVIVGMLRGAALLPATWREQWGAVLGDAARWLLSRPRRVVAANLAIAFPDLSDAQRQALLCQHFRALGQAALELGPLWFWPLPRASGLIREVIGVEAVDAALAQGRGVILFTAHLGAWEAAVQYIGQRWPVTVLYMETRNPALNQLMATGRGRSGADLTAKEEGIRPLLQALQRQQVVGILPDQNVDPREGDYAPFFGRPACTTPLLGRLAQRRQSPVFGLFAYRLPRGQGFRLEFVPMPENFPAGEAVADATAMNTVLESAIRKAPEQYWWVHRRFKDQPEGWDYPY